MRLRAIQVLACLLLLVGASPRVEGTWTRHVIDDESRGADGVRLADVNGDSLPDMTTGWEEGGITRVYLHPGPGQVDRPWPAVTVGTTPSVEDAVFVDLDEDGAVDVVSSCEGSTRTVFVHWAPAPTAALLRPETWRTEAVPATQGRAAWMFALPMQIDRQHGPDVVVGAKGDGAMVGWLRAPADARSLAGWTLLPIRSAGWIMSLVARDIDQDGDLDILLSDRKGDRTGVVWLENPGPERASRPWPEHRIGAGGREVMFLDIVPSAETDLLACAVKPDQVFLFRRPPIPRDPWPAQVLTITHPDGIGRAKAVAIGDMNQDGSLDLVYSCEGADPPRRGLVWFTVPPPGGVSEPPTHDIGGPDGIKFDRIELVDLDRDGDVDVLTCEERHQGRGLGVIWYENPARP